MEQRKSLKEVLKRLYSLLDWKQKRSFLLIVFIMILSAGLSQLTPKAIGWLTDDILGQSGLDFSGIIPLLLFILAVNAFNELIKIWRRIIVEDTATKTEKKARAMAILSLLLALCGIVYVLEALSDILQVGYFRATGGKRLFKMAPLHHHFELCGLSEGRIDLLFTLVSAAGCLLAYLAYVRFFPVL